MQCRRKAVNCKQTERENNKLRQRERDFTVNYQTNIPKTYIRNTTVIYSNRYEQLIGEEFYLTNMPTENVRKTCESNLQSMATKWLLAGITSEENQSTETGQTSHLTRTNQY